MYAYMHACMYVSACMYMCSAQIMVTQSVAPIIKHKSSSFDILFELYPI